MVRATRAVQFLLVAAVAWALALLHRGFPLAWDEIEFFRATRWIGEGRVPFRDFWEHHLPLLWICFAPVARFFADGPGTGSVVVMRWAQLPVWCAVFAVTFALARRAGSGQWSRWLAHLLLLTASSFVLSALQYRVEALAALAFLAALLVAGEGRSSMWRWWAFGSLASLAVLVNMRLAPLVVFAGALMMLVDADGLRWRWNGRALWMLPGALTVALPFVAWLRWAGAWKGFREGVFLYNSVSNRWAEDTAGTFGPQLLAPLTSGDVGGVALWLAALAGVVVAAAGWRRPGAMQIAALLFVASVATIGLAGVHYPYHFVIAWLLMVPLASHALEKLAARAGDGTSWKAVVAAIPAIALLLQVVPFFGRPFGAGMDYQNLVMKEADRRTEPYGRVWDGCGYALRREPAYRYWFLPAGVRFMARERLIEPFDFEQITSDPPAAIVYNHRVHLWLLTFPRLGGYVVHHYLPLYRNLWVPGMSAIVEPGPRPTVWRVPAGGRYEIWLSDILPKHPWFARPMEYGMFQGEDALLMEVPLDRLPLLPPGSLRWSVDGRPVPQGTRVLDLRRGARLEVVSTARERAGVLVAPAGVRTLFGATGERFLF